MKKDTETQINRRERASTMKEDTETQVDWRKRASTMEIEELEKLVADKGAELPPRWHYFSKAEQKAVIGSFLAGGLTALGLRTMKPGDLVLGAQMNRVADEMEEMVRRGIQDDLLN